MGRDGVEEKELLTASTAGTGRETDPKLKVWMVFCFGNCSLFTYLVLVQWNVGWVYTCDSNLTLWSPASARPLKLLLLGTSLYQVLPKVPQGQPGKFVWQMVPFSNFSLNCLLWSLLWPLRPLWRAFCLLSLLVCGNPIVESVRSTLSDNWWCGLMTFKIAWADVVN